VLAAQGYRSDEIVKKWRLSKGGTSWPKCGSLLRTTTQERRKNERGETSSRGGWGFEREGWRVKRKERTVSGGGEKSGTSGSEGKYTKLADGGGQLSTDGRA